MEQAFYVGPVPYQMYVVCRDPLAGASRATALLFIHGANHTGLCWEHLPDGRPGWVGSFRQAGYTVYTVDLPGHGRSPLPEDFPTLRLDRAVTAVQELLTRVGPAVLVGHSMGGHVLDRVVATAAPEVRAQVAAAVLVAPVSPPDLVRGGPPPILEQEAVRLERERARALFASSDRFPRAHFENYFSSLVPESPASYNDFQQPGRVPPVGAGAYAGIPALVVGAEQDFIPEENWRRRAEYFGMEFVMLGRDWDLPGYGHMLMLEDSEGAVARRLQHWLADHGIA
ncbi:MAG: alpha/beta hydrolase [Chloroflexi bacterium]|nr:alpha/beta hydrolase [Chloroflexota bacterium]